VNQDVLDQELEKKNKHIEKLIQTNYKLEENVKYLEIKITDLEEQNKILQQNFALKNNENNRIKIKLSEVFFFFLNSSFLSIFKLTFLNQTEKTIDEIFFHKKAESTALLELDYLKGDVERLLHLLKTTEEVLFY